MNNPKGSRSFARNQKGRVGFDLLYFAYFILAMILKVVYFQFESGLNERPFSSPMNSHMLVATAGILLIIFGFVLFIFVKQSRFSLFFVNLLISSLIIADVLYFRYYETPINMALLYQIGYVGQVSSSIQSLFRYRDIWLFIDLPVYFIFRYIYKKLGYRKDTYRHKVKIRWAISIIAILIGLPMIKYSFDRSDSMQYQWNRNYAARDLGILYYHYYDVKTFIKEETAKRKPLTEEEKQLVENYFNNKQSQVKDIQYFGKYKGKNLIIIQMEALQTFLFERDIEGKPITPFMNSLIEDSLYFPNIYYQVGGGNTSDAEFMTNNSLYPAPSGAVYFRFPVNRYLSLPKKLTSEGYKPFVFHAYKPSFWNRSAIYPNLGFNTFINFNNFELDEKMGWALSDTSFFRQGTAYLEGNEPFYGFFVTLSSHHPYDAFYGYNDFNVGKYEDKQVGNYIKSASYVDKSVESFFKLLKEKGLYENTIFAIYGDHAGIFEDQQEDLTDFLDIPFDPYNWQKIQKIPLILHVPDSELKGRINTVGGQVDFLPTIANLLGIEMPYTIGKDLLNTKEDEGYAVLRYSSVMTQDYMYLSSETKVYAMDTGKELPLSDYMDEINKYLIDLQVSDIILQKDYFKKMNIQ